MKDNPEQIKKLVIKPNEIEDDNSWRLSLNKNLISCNDCNSNLNYIKLEWGIVAEDDDFQIMGHRDKRNYRLREVGITIYCAECGCFDENYSKWFYPEERFIMRFDELEEAEMPEIDYCLNQFNQRGDFKPQYSFSELGELKKKLLEYEKRYPLKVKKKIIKKKKVVKKKGGNK